MGNGGSIRSIGPLSASADSDIPSCCSQQRMTVLPDFSARPCEHEHFRACLTTELADGILAGQKMTISAGPAVLPTLCMSGNGRWVREAPEDPSWTRCRP